MLLYNLPDLFLTKQRRVPDRVGVHDHRGPMFAEIQAARFLGANFCAEAKLRDRLLEKLHQLDRALGATGGASALWWTFVSAHKDVVRKPTLPKSHAALHRGGDLPTGSMP